MKKIIFIESSLGNPNNIKRIEEFVEKGYDVSAYAFDRGVGVKNRPKNVNVEIIGEFKSDSSYASRIGIIRKGIVETLQKHKNDDCIFYLFRNDIAQIYKLLSRRPYIFEEADMTHLNIRFAFIRKWMEWNVKRVIKRSVVSVFRSEGFLQYHFGDNRPNNVYVIPNRLHPDVLKQPSFPSRNVDENCLKFGFVGLIRYDSIFSFVNTLLNNFPQHEFHFWGRFPSQKDEALFSSLEKYPNCFFHGGFQSPDDLPKIYSQIDLLLSTYDVSSINPRYAEPNKLYEAIYFNTPIIVSSNSFLSDKVARLGIGYDVNALDKAEVIELIRNINADNIIEKHNCISAIDKKTCINSNDDFFIKIDKLLN